MTKTHWSERTACICGKVFKVGTQAEAMHRHNFPTLCKRPKPKKTQGRWKGDLQAKGEV